MDDSPVSIINDSQEENIWYCRSCGLQFESKGKRDAHHRKQHQKLTIAGCAGQKKLCVKRTAAGKFGCSCGKEFLHVQSLQRHCKRCKELIEIEVENSENEERNNPY